MLGDTDSPISLTRGLDKEHIVLIGRALVDACGGEVPQGTADFLPKVLDLIRPLASLPDYQMSNEIHRMHMAARWVATGMPTFVPTQGLAASLVLTAYKGITFSDVPLPFSTFCTQVPSGWLKPPFDQVSSIWLNLISCYQRPNGDICLGGTPESQPEESLRATVVWRTDILSRGSSLVYHQVVDNDQDVERWLAQSSIQKSSEDLDDAEYGVITLCTRLVVGLCLYIATTTLGPPTNSHKAKGKGDKKDKPRVWVLGSNVKLPAHMRAAAGDLTQSYRRRTKGAGDAWKLSKRFVVRGHFKRVRIGPLVAWSYKTTWIEPYWKGPESGLLLERVYSVNQTQDQVE